MTGVPAPGWGGRIAIASSVALLAIGLLGVPAYVSSTATAALAIQIDESCLTDLGIALHVDPSHGQTTEAIHRRAAAIEHTGPPTQERGSSVRIVPDPASAADGDTAAGPPRVARLLWRPELPDVLDIDAAALSDGAVLVPDWATVDGLYQPGDDVYLATDPAGDTPANVLTLSVTGTYPDIPTRPEPPAWCSHRDLFRLSAFGDRPPPVFFTTAATIEAQPAGTWFELWRIAPDPDGLRVDEAEELLVDLRRWQDEVWAEAGLPENRKPAIPLETSIARSRQVSDYVRLTIEPLRYATVIAAGVLLVASSLLAARAQRAELRLRVVRGDGPLRLALAQWRWLLPVTSTGVVLGSVAGWLAVRLLGPASGIEPSALRSGVIAALLGCVGATLLVALAIGRAGASTVDRPLRGHRVRLAPAGLAIAVVLVAVWSFERLDRAGGVRQIGVEVRGGDLLAQAFPLLGALAALVVVAGPLVLLARRLRAVGRRAPVPLLLGIRRVGVEPVITSALVLSTALAVAVAFQASTLTRSVDQLLADKATVFVGSDLSISTIDPAGDLSGLGLSGLGGATEVVQTTTEDRAMLVLGIDVESFVRGVRFRADGLPIPLADAVAGLAADPQGSAIVIDPDDALAESLANGTLETVIRGEEHAFDVVAEGDFFPGYRRGRPMIVVDRSVLAERGEREVWVRDPVADAVTLLEDRDVRATSSITPSEVFDSTNYLSARWAYATLTTFAVVVAIVTLVGQLLVIEARRRQRRVSRVLSAPMGLRRRDDLVASAVEVGLPLVCGSLLGSLVGWLTARLAISRLDSLRDRPPPARLMVEAGPLLVAAGAVVIASVALAWWASWRSERGDAMEVMRVAEQ